MVMGYGEDDGEDGGDGWWCWSKQHGAASSKSLLSPLLFTDCPPVPGWAEDAVTHGTSF